MWHGITCSMASHVACHHMWHGITFNMASQAAWHHMWHGITCGMASHVAWHHMWHGITCSMASHVVWHASHVAWQWCTGSCPSIWLPLQIYSTCFVSIHMYLTMCSNVFNSYCCINKVFEKQLLWWSVMHSLGLNSKVFFRIAVLWKNFPS